MPVGLGFEKSMEFHYSICLEEATSLQSSLGGGQHLMQLCKRCIIFSGKSIKTREMMETEWEMRKGDMPARKSNK